MASTVAPPEGLQVRDTSGETVPVTILAREEDLLAEPMAQLSRSQRDLLADLPVEDLPRELPERDGEHEILERVTEEDLWRGTLLPLAGDEKADVMLYGVTAGLLEYNTPLTDGVVLRCGDRAAYYPFSWGQNAWYEKDPWLAVADHDGDGEDEVAICLNLGGGAGMNAMQLYLVEPETMAYTVPDLKSLNLQGRWNGEEDTVTLVSEGEESLTVELPEDVAPADGLKGEWISVYSWDGGQLWFETALACGDSTFYLVQVKAPVVWKEGGYRLGPAVLKLYA